MKDLLQTKIIDKFLEFKPDAVNTIDFLRHTLSLHTRIISAYRTKRDVRMPGAMLDEDFQPVASQGNHELRDLKRHTLLWVRCDLLQPNRIEIEYCISNRKETYLFILTKEEWAKFKRALKLVPKHEDI